MRNVVLKLLIAGSLLSCSGNMDFKAIVPQHVDRFAADFVEDIRQMKIEECMQRVVPEMNTQAGRQYLTNTYRNIDRLQIDSIRIIGARVQTLMGDKGFTKYSVDYEYFTKDKFLYFSIETLEKKGKLLISGFDGRILDTSLTEIHAFTLNGKGFLHYLFLIAALLVPIFIVVTLIFAIRTKLTRKWLWIVGILFGFSTFSLNWTTGQVGVQVIKFQMLGAGIIRQGMVAPWILSCSIPIFAIYFWIKRYWDKRDNDLLVKVNDRQGENK